MVNKTSIHTEVQKHYGSIASSFVADEKLPSSSHQTSCCDSSSPCKCTSAPYDAEQLTDLPDTVKGLSLGCGDPVTIASLSPGEIVLDLGGGAGIDCFLAARQVGSQGHVIGIDMTVEMLTKANANKAKLNMDNVEFREGYIEALPVEDSTIDVIMSNCVINLSPDKPSVFHEAFRVLKPGGRISVSDIVTDGKMNEDLRRKMDLWAECITGAIDMHEYLAMMQEAGFVDVQVVDKSHNVEDQVKPLTIAPRVFSVRIMGRKPTS